MTLVFLTPASAAVGAAVILVLAGAALRERRNRRVRSALGLPPAERRARFGATLAGATAVLLLAAAAAQPALRTRSTLRRRTDAQAYVLVDVSKSMLASAAPGRPTRLDLARAMAKRLRAALPEVPFGIASLTNRPLPLLLPTPSQSTFDLVLERALAIENPPPSDLYAAGGRRETTFGTLGQLGTEGYFGADVRHRLVVLLTDGEGGPFDSSIIEEGLRLGHTSLLAVGLFGRADRIFLGGSPDPNYVSDAGSRLPLSRLLAARGTRLYGPGELGAVVAAARAALGSGPTAAVATTSHARPLARWLVVAALVALALALARLLPLPKRLRRRVPAL